MCDSNPRSERERPVRCGHGARTELFPRCGSSPGEFFAIVRGNHSGTVAKFFMRAFLIGIDWNLGDLARAHRAVLRNQMQRVRRRNAESDDVWFQHLDFGG